MENASVSSGAPDQQPAFDARAALSEVTSGRAALARQLRRGPRWYDAVYGAAVGVFVLGYGLPLPWLFLPVVVALATFRVLIRVYHDRTGIVLGATAPRPRPLRRLTWGVTALLAAGIAGTFVAGRAGLHLLVVLIAVVVGVGAWQLSHRFTVVQLELTDAA